MKNTQVSRTPDGKFQKGVSASPEKRFTSENQPTGAAKSLGKLKKKRGTELIRAILDLQGKEISIVKKQAADYFAIDENEITVESLLVLQQIRKAIQRSDTTAFNTIMDRLYGKPSQPAQLELSEKKTFLDLLKETSVRDH